MAKQPYQHYFAVGMESARSYVGSPRKELPRLTICSEESVPYWLAHQCAVAYERGETYGQQEHEWALVDLVSINRNPIVKKLVVWEKHLSLYTREVWLDIPNEHLRSSRLMCPMQMSIGTWGINIEPAVLSRIKVEDEKRNCSTFVQNGFVVRQLKSGAKEGFLKYPYSQTHGPTSPFPGGFCFGSDECGGQNKQMFANMVYKNIPALFTETLAALLVINPQDWKSLIQNSRLREAERR